MEKRSYKITCSLKEGYSANGKLHTIKFAGKVIQQWMEQRLQQGQPIVNGLLQEGQLFFPAVNARESQSVTVSPTAVYYGELSSPEDMKRKNKGVKKTLESLAEQLKKDLKQESVFIIYRDENWCV